MFLDNNQKIKMMKLSSCFMSFAVQLILFISFVLCNDIEHQHNLTAENDDISPLSSKFVVNDNEYVKHDHDIHDNKNDTRIPRVTTCCDLCRSWDYDYGTCARCKKDTCNDYNGTCKSGRYCKCGYY